MLPNGNIALLRYLHKHANLGQTTHFLNKIKERKKAKKTATTSYKLPAAIV